jgi:hypothetical protein
VAPGSITVNRDFKVKHGINVAEGGTFGGTVTVATPTQNTHAATKLYVDTAVGTPIVPTESTAPQNPVDGQLWFDTASRHLSIYSTDAVEWIMIATFEDTANLREHIHDTSIGGNGLIVSIYQDAGYYDAIFSSSQDAGYYDLNEWAMTWNGGIAIDNFN